jgi:hypothetical protein
LETAFDQFHFLCCKYISSKHIENGVIIEYTSSFKTASTPA